MHLNILTYLQVTLLDLCHRFFSAFCRLPVSYPLTKGKSFGSPKVSSGGRNQRVKARKSEVTIDTTHLLDGGWAQPTET